MSASRRGSSHSSDVPNQDAVRCEQLTLTDSDDIWVAAVADGHGGARYVRSDVGARTAVDVAVDSVRAALEAAPEADLSTLLRAQVPHIVDAWREAVRAHAATHPFTEAEHRRAGADPGGGEGLIAYGATLQVALVGDQGVAVAQVGDGDVLVRSHGFATRPVPGDDRLVAGETTSLCLPTAVDDFRYAFLPASAEPDLVLLATDGYGNSFAQADWWQGLLDDVAAFVQRLGVRQLEEQLPDWLEESARVGGDDVSAVLVVRRPLAVEAPGAAVPVPIAPETMARERTLELPGKRPDDPATRRRPARHGHTMIIALLTTALVVLGVLAALFLLGPDDLADPVDNPSDPSTSTPPARTVTDDVTGEKKAGNKSGGDKLGRSPSDGPRRQGGDGPQGQPPLGEDTAQPQKQFPSVG